MAAQMAEMQRQMQEMELKMAKQMRANAELTDALVAENQAGQFGGAVYLYEGVAVFTRLTFSGNSLTSDYPDGQDIFVYDNQISASLFVRDTTFTDAHRMIGKNFGIQALTDAAFEAAVKNGKNADKLVG